MLTWRRGDEHHIDFIGIDNRLIGTESTLALVFPIVRFRFSFVTTGIKPADILETGEGFTMQPRRKATAKKGQIQGFLQFRFQVSFSIKCSPTRNAFAEIVRLGFNPPEVGMKLPSTTNKFSTPRN